jgi:hypothetical protein
LGAKSKSKSDAKSSGIAGISNEHVVADQWQI